MTGRVPGGNLLDEASWECAWEPVCEASEVRPAPRDPARWVPARVPGTAAQAMVAVHGQAALAMAYDDLDWWYRCRFRLDDPSGAHELRLDGLATVADVWLNGAPLLRSEGMFLTHRVDVPSLSEDNELLIRFAALTPLLARRRPRPRWKSRDLPHQNLRWLRTTLTGRQLGGVRSPAPVGPWRPVSLVARSPLRVVDQRLSASLTADGAGVLELSARLHGAAPGRPAFLEVGGVRAQLDTWEDGDGHRLSGSVTVPSVRPWWPHTHGSQDLYDSWLVVEDQRHHLGRVGFRTVEVDRTGGAFTLVWNGRRVFCRGVCWTPPDPVSLTIDRDELRARLELIRDGNLNMVRVTGTGVYESQDFFDLCDELGLLVWQDCMFAFCDVPDEPDFARQVRDELTCVLTPLQGRPSLAVLCGGSENEQQAAYLGLPPESWPSPVAHSLIPTVVAELVPGTPYVANTPGESLLPSMVDTGPSHYFGVGAYLRPLEDARRSGVRFASECLAFANPPEVLDTADGQLALLGLGHHPDRKAVVHRDAASSWDLEDIRDWYTDRLFGVDVRALRRSDPERAADLARAAVATIFEAVLTEWRRPGSSCWGALVLQSHDVGFGAGAGIVDGFGRPKSPWYAMRRRMAASVVGLTDEGVNGLGLHVASDRTDTWYAAVRLDLYLDGRVLAESTTIDVTVRDGGATVPTATAFGGFRDLNDAHRFGPPAHDVVAATLLDTEGAELSHAVFLPGQALRPVEPDLGLRAVAHQTPGAGWEITVSTERFAQWLTFDVPGWIPLDNWFHLLPGCSSVVSLRAEPGDPTQQPRGEVRALNCARPTRITGPWS